MVSTQHKSLVSAIHKHYAWPDPLSWDGTFKRVNICDNWERSLLYQSHNKNALCVLSQNAIWMKPNPSQYSTKVKKNLNPSCSQTQDVLVKKRQSHANFPLKYVTFYLQYHECHVFYAIFLPVCKSYSMSLSRVQYLCARVDIFREKKYSTEHGTNGNFDSFRWNSTCFEERKTLGNLFQAIPRKIRKNAEFRSKPFCRKGKTLGTL